MPMFLLAFTYDLQSPADDGSCTQWVTEESCIQRKSYLDSTQSYCQWSFTTNDDMGPSFSGYSCSYQDPVSTVQAVLTISVLVSLITALFKQPINYIFKILNAPLSNRIKVMPTSQSDKDGSSFEELLRNHHISKVAGVKVRDISEATISARSAVWRTLNRWPHFPTLQIREYKQLTKHLRNRRVQTAEDNQLSIANDNFSVDFLKTHFLTKMCRQREALSGRQLEEFDSRWGILQSTETTVDHPSDTTEPLFGPRILDKICCHIAGVFDQAQSKLEILRVTTEEQIGLEIFHLFIVDLLGRDSPAAKIFQSKLCADFGETNVVKYNRKVAAAVVLVTMNILFAYYSILYGSVRGQSWQIIYLEACLIQFFIEVFINETLECVWLHYVVPSMVSREVIAAHQILVDAVEKFCSSVAPNTYALSSGVFNAAEYLFVSTNVAKAFPTFMESVIVQFYTTSYPGECSKPWYQSRWQRFWNRIQTPQGGNVLLRYTATFLLTVLLLLEYGATSPYLLQKMFIRTCQPFLISGIVLAFYLVIVSPVYTTLFFMSAVVVVMYANRKRLSTFVLKPRSVAVTPVITCPVLSNQETTVGNDNRWSNDDDSIHILSAVSLSSKRSNFPSNIFSDIPGSSDGSSGFYSSPLDSSAESSISNGS